MPRGSGIPIVDALPELALVRAGKHGAVFLRLVFENGLLLQRQFEFGHRHENVSLLQRPLLPRTAVQPHNRAALLWQPLHRRLDNPQTDAVRAVRIRQIAGHQDAMGLDFLQQFECLLNVFLAGRVLFDRAGLIEREIHEDAFVALQADVRGAADGFRFADEALDVADFLDVGVAGFLFCARNCSTRSRSLPCSAALKPWAWRYFSTKSI